MSNRQRMGESREEADSKPSRSSPAPGWFVRGVGLAFILASLSLAVIAVCLVVLVMQLPELLELGWSAIGSADALTEAIEQHGGAL